jgi:hypothetical protein
MSQLECLTEQAQSLVSEEKEAGRLAAISSAGRLFGGLAATLSWPYGGRALVR